MLKFLSYIFGDEGMVKLTMPILFLSAFVLAAGYMVKRIYILPKGTLNGIEIAASPPPLMMQFTQININPLCVMGVILLIMFFTIAMIFFGRLGEN
jgi:hypothetical protein